MRHFTIKKTYILGFFSCVILLGIALYMQLVWQLIPCVLCVIQRFIVLILALLFLIGLIFHHRRPIRIHAAVLFSVSLFGALVASRQVWLQYFSQNQHTDCAPSLTFMLQNMPWNEAIKRIIGGNGDCGVIEWTFLHLSIPAWTLIFFILVCVLAVINYRRA